VEGREAYCIFDPIASPAESIVLEVEKLEARMDVFDEFADLEGSGEVA
jgi:hypothetical protein